MGGSSILPMNTLSLIHGEFLVSVMNYKVNQKIRDCDPFNTLISDCVEAYYTPNISDNVKGYFDRVAFNSEMKMTSLSKVNELQTLIVISMYKNISIVDCKPNRMQRTLHSNWLLPEDDNDW